MNIIKNILELLYPTTCIFCGKICKNGICDTCRKKAPCIREPRCKKCGKPIRREEAEFCHDCNRQTFSYEQGRSLWIHKEPVQGAIYAFKYKNRRVYGEVFAKEMADRFEGLVRLWRIDCLIPVPLHKKRRRKRGFNQAELLAEELGKRLRIPVDSTLIAREKETTPQKELEQGNRKKNLRKAFRLTRPGIKGKRILIVDDIYTTGSTIDAMAEILKEAGGEKIYFLTISIGQGF